VLSGLGVDEQRIGDVGATLEPPRAIVVRAPACG
jgi:hypothetical protein